MPRDNENSKCTACGFHGFRADGEPCPKCGAKPCPCPRCRVAEGYGPNDPEVIDWDKRHKAKTK